MLNPQLKTPNYRDEKYKAFIRSKLCLVKDCDSGQRIDPHHESFGLNGMRYKAPDTHCLPICRKHHHERNNIGSKDFYYLHRINAEYECIRLLTEYIKNMEITNDKKY